MEKINWYGSYILTIREVKRFFRVYHQTVITPAVSSLIFLAMFNLALGNKKAEINGIKFIDFIGYGIISMSIIQQSFANSSSSLIMSKVIGYIRDIITPPFGSVEIILAYTLSSVLRGIFVGIIVMITLSPFVNYTFHHPLLLIFYVLLSCSLLGTLGILSGLIVNTFDQNSAITNYLIMPLSFLSGTFYSVKSLPLWIQKINLFNPLFYIIDGFRYCFTGKSDGNILAGFIFLIISNIIIVLLIDRIIRTGWRIKS